MSWFWILVWMHFGCLVCYSWIILYFVGYLLFSQRFATCYEYVNRQLWVQVLLCILFSFAPCSERIYVAVTDMAALFPKVSFNLSSWTVRLCFCVYVKWWCVIYLILRSLHLHLHIPWHWQWNTILMPIKKGYFINQNKQMAFDYTSSFHM